MKQSTSRLPTLRQYIDSYQGLKKSKSNNNLFVSQKIQMLSKPTLQLQHSINEKVNIIKNGLTRKLQTNTGLSIVEHFYDLTKLINQLVLKLKSLQGIQGSMKNIGPVSTHHLSAHNLHKDPDLAKKISIEQSIQQIKDETPAVAPAPPRLISPKQMSIKLNFTKELINLNSSLATQDFTPLSTPKQFNKKNNFQSIRLKKTSHFFNKQINPINSLGLNLLQQNNFSSEAQNQREYQPQSPNSAYKIKISNLK